MLMHWCGEEVWRIEKAVTAGHNCPKRFSAFFENETTHPPTTPIQCRKSQRLHIQKDYESCSMACVKRQGNLVLSR